MNIENQKINTVDLGNGIHFIRVKDGYADSFKGKKLEFYNYEIDSYFSVYFKNEAELKMGKYRSDIIETNDLKKGLEGCVPQECIRSYHFLFFYLISHQWRSTNKYYTNFHKGAFIALKTVEQQYCDINADRTDLLKIHKLRLEYYRNLQIATYLPEIRKNYYEGKTLAL
ncbi:hypothetical protein CQA57_07975 [Helicobacter anseris]|uniref:Uncharacterized protein n=1 Tax=Helicobacter anseris TaxID=375926 RepID=A0A3D8J0R1_9HELI|nr:hypothetical protein [Helicobacter anseris]RDU71078.1 hypothetical protein CQA57_07975 [Helicobacter anseris]